MRSSEVKELRGMTEDELNKKIIQLRKDQLHHRIQHSIGQFTDLAKFSECRKNIARVKTVLNERKKVNK